MADPVALNEMIASRYEYALRGTVYQFLTCAREMNERRSSQSDQEWARKAWKSLKDEWGFSKAELWLLVLAYEDVRQDGHRCIESLIREKLRVVKGG